MTRNNIGDIRELIHEGRASDLGCLTLGRYRLEILIDNGDLDEDKLGYLISLLDGFLFIHQGSTFYVDPTARTDSANSLGFAREFPECFLRILAPG